MQRGEENRRIGDQQRAMAFEHFGIRQPKQATHMRVFGFVQFEQLVALLNLEERFVFRECLLLE